MKQNIENNHEYVDLGLSVKWATCNVGASSPEEYGDYFAWGETEPKDIYNFDTYKWYQLNNETKSDLHKQRCFRRNSKTVHKKRNKHKRCAVVAVRLANSIDDSEKQEGKDIETFLARLRDIPTVSRREIAYCIRNLLRTNRSLSILVEMLREDLDERIHND